MRPTHTVLCFVRENEWHTKIKNEQTNSVCSNGENDPFHNTDIKCSALRVGRAFMFAKTISGDAAC